MQAHPHQPCFGDLRRSFALRGCARHHAASAGVFLMPSLICLCMHLVIQQELEHSGRSPRWLLAGLVRLHGCPETPTLCCPEGGPGKSV